MSAPLFWRLLLDGAASGARNMAVDETLLHQAAQSVASGAASGAATLRFYSWKPHCLSLGRLQKSLPPAVFDGAIGTDVVRRPTGGRAVWHAHEITYALAMPLNGLPPDARTVNGAYRWLSDGFLAGLRDLGLPVEMAASGVRTQGPNCFAASAHCDFIVEGKKLIGAAQCRRADALLQHGSLLLSIDRDQWEHRAGGPMHDAISLQDLRVPVESSSNVERIIAHLCGGFERVTGAHLQRGALSQAEERAVAQLEARKYRGEAWTREAHDSANEGG